jgi:hypothetical protein
MALNGRSGITAAPAAPPLDEIDALSKFTQKFSLTYPGLKTSFNNYYDAFYFLAYAAYAGPRQAFFNGLITASDFETAIFRLTDLAAAKVNVGPDEMSTGFKELNEAFSTIQLYGTMGPPDFDRSVGMRRESGSIYCFDSQTLKMQRDTIRYNRQTKELTQMQSPVCLRSFLTQ